MYSSITYNNTAIYYKKVGEGKPVVLLHGFGEDDSIFNAQINYLKTYFSLIIPQIPGTGNSAFIAYKPITELTITDYAHCINAILEAEKIATCVMLGHSMGGYITLAFAELYEYKLDKWGLIHSTAFADSAEKKEMRKKGIAAMDEYGGYAFLKNTIPNLFSEKSKAIYKHKIAALIENSKTFNTASLQQYYYAMMNRPDRTHVLKQTTKPVLFILGTQDIAAPLNDVLQQVYLPKKTYIHILNDVGHMGMIEAAEKVNNHIYYFLN